MNEAGMAAVSARRGFAAWALLLALLVLPATLARPDEKPAEDAKPAAEESPEKDGASPAPAPSRATPTKQAPSKPSRAGRAATTAAPAARSAAAHPSGAETPARAPEEAPLRFDDEDLERYRRPPRADPGDADLPVEPAAVPTPKPAGAPAKTTPPAAAKTAGGGAVGQTKSSGPVTLGPAPAVKRPPRKKNPPTPDPLAPFKQREAHEKFRAEQIEGLRGKIAELESRLEYLKAKRIAILDPLNVMPRAQSDEDRQTETALKPEALLLQVETEIAGAERQLEETRTALAEIQMRFGAEAGIR